MTPKRVAVIGGGTMGLAAAWRLAREGLEVTVYERFGHIHTYGSHGGHTRVIRRAYHEGSRYVPFVNRAMEMWRDLGGDLFEKCGVLVAGPADDPNIVEAFLSAEVSGIEYERMSASGIRARWPFEFPDGWVGCWSPSDGYLRVDKCMNAMREAAVDLGVRFEYGTPVELTDVDADVVVLAKGAYTTELGEHVVAQRRVLSWTKPPEAHRETLASIPVWAAFTRAGFFYGFPWRDEGIDGFKLACHEVNIDTVVDPLTLSRTTQDADREPLDNFLAAHVPLGIGPHVQSMVCLYGTTASGDFIIDRHPNDDHVIVAAGFSGHGFKFAPAIGEVIADMVARGATSSWPLPA